MNNLFNVKDKCIVITGGAGVLCSAMAKFLAGNGAKIFILDINKKEAEAACKRIESENGFAAAIQADVTDKKQLQRACNIVEEKAGRIDVLINGAGGNKKEATTSEELSFFDITAGAVRDVFDLNFLGTFLCCQVFGRQMAEQKEGVILNISSMNAFRPLTKIAAYSAAKAAVSNFTQWLAAHMCQNYSENIRVNAIAPGFFLTEQNKFLLRDEKSSQLTERGKRIIEHTPMDRFGKAEELCGTVMWLISDASKFVTGIVVAIDGGFSAFSGI